MSAAQGGSSAGKRCAGAGGGAGKRGSAPRLPRPCPSPDRANRKAVWMCRYTMFMTVEQCQAANCSNSGKCLTQVFRIRRSFRDKISKGDSACADDDRLWVLLIHDGVHTPEAPCRGRRRGDCMAEARGG